MTVLESGSNSIAIFALTMKYQTFSVSAVLSYTITEVCKEWLRLQKLLREVIKLIKKLLMSKIIVSLYAEIVKHSTLREEKKNFYLFQVSASNQKTAVHNKSINYERYRGSVLRY